MAAAQFRKVFRMCAFATKRIFRGILFGLFASAFVFPLIIFRNNRIELQPLKVVESSVISLKGKNEKLIIRDVDGRKVFRIEGLPSQKLKEQRNFVIPTTLSPKIKAELSANIEAIYAKRKQTLTKSCGRAKKSRWVDGMQLVAVPQKNLTVCVVQKAGSSSWHRLVYKMREPNGTWNGLRHQLNREHGKHLLSAEKQRLMKSDKGTRVIAVRHPFARLISGWNDKLHKNHLLESTKILTTLTGIEHYIRKSEPDDNHIISFKDFAQYLADKSLRDVDLHFRPIEQLCQPCRFPYDFVAKAETSRKHLWWVLDRVGAVMPSFTKHIASGSGEDNIDTKTDPWETEKKIMSAFFKKLPVETVIKLKKLYQADFERFGYTFDIDTMTAGDITD